ncbi:hypothetical protein J2794_000578 [Paraburkholderia terricola]|uniref:hypothetical protein n=1 Tax=Paraburkholderia terricola TaxID=169427 RepID=UPI00285D5A30|nr:hypothetical protein [Paraburkholderia terricola]MDR6444489.1 hypothetical protein [Paraburkholderia terricola]
MKLTKQDGLGAAAGEAVPGFGERNADFQNANKGAGKALSEACVDAEAAFMTMLLPKKQFDFGSHNKMHRKSRRVFRIGCPIPSFYS